MSTQDGVKVWLQALAVSIFSYLPSILLWYPVYDSFCLKIVKAELLVKKVVEACMTLSSLECFVSNMQLTYFDKSCWV